MLTDNDIMKALRCCADRYCKGCSEQGKANCRESIAALAWDLICRQKAEIAEYKKHIDQDIIYQKAVEVEAIKGFAEKLKENVTYFEDECGNFVPFVDCRDIEKLLETTGEKT